MSDGGNVHVLGFFKRRSLGCYIACYRVPEAGVTDHPQLPSGCHQVRGLLFMAQEVQNKSPSGLKTKGLNQI